MGRRFVDVRTIKARMQQKDERMAREQAQRAEAVSDFEMVNAMIAFGGSFVTALGRTWHLADETNRAKLLAAFPELVDQYRELARLKRLAERSK